MTTPTQTSARPSTITKEDENLAELVGYHVGRYRPDAGKFGAVFNGHLLYWYAHQDQRDAAWGAYWSGFDAGRACRAYRHGDGDLVIEAVEV